MVEKQILNVGNTGLLTGYEIALYAIAIQHPILIVFDGRLWIDVTGLIKGKDSKSDGRDKNRADTDAARSTERQISSLSFTVY